MRYINLHFTYLLTIECLVVRAVACERGDDDVGSSGSCTSFGC